MYTLTLDIISNKPLLRLHHLQNGRRNGQDRRSGGENSTSATGSSPRNPNPADEEFYCC